ncbi:MAG: SDR family NAD(P)-dependent oxidoreductase [Betaproteobacteria bacterium]|nr:SDR family NAD(P)-dependent oxidoreductase [Betaproteobacteria bacterium]
MRGPECLPVFAQVDDPSTNEQKSGHVINVSSVYRHKVVATGAVYCATKHGVRAISEALRQEVNDYSIRVTTISPGAVRTELTDHITEPGLAESVRDGVAKIGVPASTMANMVAFAISPPDDVDVNEILFRPTVQPT